MKRIILVCILFCTKQILFSQSVPTPTQTTLAASVKYITSAKYIKKSSYDYSIYNENGEKLKDIKELGFIKTETLSVLHKPSRTIILLDDFEVAPEDVVRDASILKRNISKDFYLTTPNSFNNYINDKSYTSKITNVNGSYIAYIPELGKTYLEKDIRKFSNWGARDLIDLGDAPESTFWYRDIEKKEYGIVKEGKAIDYSKATSKYENNDYVVSIDDTPKYRLKNFKIISKSFDFIPIEIINKAPVKSVTTGCVRGDCLNGWGKWQYESGHYDGFWENGKRQGYGLFKWEDSSKYIGAWYNGNMDGYGVYIAENEDNIIGEYKNSQLNGLGITVTNNKWQQGIYKDGNITKAYILTSNNKESGCTAGNCLNEYGRFKWANGDSFTGFFKNGNIYMGTYKFSNGNKYSGKFNSNSQYHGTGRFFFKDGSYYGGTWKDGKYHGKGYYHDKDLVQKIGEWVDGVLVNSYK